MIDVKKLITGFLVLAVVAVGAGATFSFIINSSHGQSKGTTTGLQIQGADSNDAPVATNAFVDTGSLQGNAAELLSDTDTTSTDAQASDPDNLTSLLADSYIDELTAANPDGLTTNQSGTMSIATPNMQIVTQSIASNPAFQSLVIPNWDTEAQSEPITVGTSSSQGAISQYGSSLTSIFNTYFVSNGLQNDIQNQTADPSDFPYIYSQVQGALNATLALQTPPSLVGFQQSLVRMMVYEENSVQLAENASGDPVKQAIVFQGEHDKYVAAMNSLQQQMQNASSLGLSFENGPGTSAPLIAELFGVQTAHAQWLTFDASNFADWLEDFLNNELLQILKNTLIALIQKKVLTAIQGAHNVPKFVTDFATQMVNSYQSAALNTLNSELSNAPLYQSSALNALLSTPYQSPSTIARTVGQLASPDSNIGQLANGFTNFNDYVHLFGQGGNVWATAMTIQQDSAAAGANSQTANQTQNVAQQGWSPDESCADGSDPQDNVNFVCPAGSTLDPDLVGGCDYPDGSYVTATPIPTPGKCANGQNPVITNPGQVTGQTMNAALQSGTQLITSADDITGLVEALTTSLISQLTQQAINTINGAIGGGAGNNPGVGGIVSSTISSGTASASTTLQCLPTIQPVQISSSTGIAIANVSAVGGPVDTACVAANDCPSTENSNGTPLYTWSAQGSVQGGNGATVLSGSSLTLTYSTPGTYYATVTASTAPYPQASCAITVTGP